MEWIQYIIRLKPRTRGFHIVTDEVVSQLSELKDIEVGLLNLFIQHTSASLLINENASPDVRRDLERQLQEIVPDGPHNYEHIAEGSDDMPAHIKSALLGNSVTIPIRNGALLLGTWQGIYLGEHRNDGGSRNIVATLTGRKR